MYHVICQVLGQEGWLPETRLWILEVAPTDPKRWSHHVCGVALCSVWHLSPHIMCVPLTGIIMLITSALYIWCGDTGGTLTTCVVWYLGPHTVSLCLGYKSVKWYDAGDRSNVMVLGGIQQYNSTSDYKLTSCQNRSYNQVQEYFKLFTTIIIIIII